MAHAVAMSNVDTKPLSEYEQPLPIRERDADMNVTDTVGAGAWEAAMRRHEVERGHGATLIQKQSAS